MYSTLESYNYQACYLQRSLTLEVLDSSISRMASVCIQQFTTLCLLCSGSNNEAVNVITMVGGSKSKNTHTFLVDDVIRVPTQCGPQPGHYLLAGESLPMTGF